MEKKTYKTPGVESYYARIEDVLQQVVTEIEGNAGLILGGSDGGPSGSTEPARTKERNSWEEESFNAETQSAQSNSLW